MDEHHLDEVENQKDPTQNSSEASLGLGVESGSGDEKKQATAIEQGVSTSQQPPLASLPQISSQSPPPTTTSSPLDLNQVGVPVSNDSPMIADDSDLIEKEWVEKAKAIVEQTKSDPKEQGHRLNLLKSDYLKKRYNHELKLPED